MAAIEVHSPAELTECRRKMQGKRRVSDRIAMALSMGAVAFGLFWVIGGMMGTITCGCDSISVAVYTEMTPRPNAAGGA
ncbi:phosphate transporter permease subunit PtsA, partial [Klebsiella pneumoniae]